MHCCIAFACWAGKLGTACTLGHCTRPFLLQAGELSNMTCRRASTSMWLARDHNSTSAFPDVCVQRPGAWQKAKTSYWPASNHPNFYPLQKAQRRSECVFVPPFHAVQHLLSVLCYVLRLVRDFAPQRGSCSTTPATKRGENNNHNVTTSCLLAKALECGAAKIPKKRHEKVGFRCSTTSTLNGPEREQLLSNVHWGRICQGARVSVPLQSAQGVLSPPSSVAPGQCPANKAQDHSRGSKTFAAAKQAL